MERKQRAVGILLLSLVLCAVQSVSAWEIELQGRVASKSALVRLGDISHISGLAAPETRDLKRMVLGPGPSRAYSRSLSASQVRKILKQRGVELHSCRFTGAARSVVVYDEQNSLFPSRASRSQSAGPRVDPRDVVRPTSYRSRGGLKRVDEIEEKVGELVNSKLMQLTEEAVPWHVEAEVASTALRKLPASWDGLAVEGLEKAKEGSHQLVACFERGDRTVRIPVEAEVARLVERVVPVRTLRSGQVIRASDVELRHVRDESDDQPLARKLDEVLGKQVRLPVRRSEPVNLDSLERPILVKRRETVQAVARRGGIKVARGVLALDQGSLGDTITVEALERGKNGKKARFVARVTGVRQVEVCVSNASTQKLGGKSR